MSLSTLSKKTHPRLRATTSRRLDIFIDTWQSVLGERRMWTVPPEWDPILEAPLEARTLSEAHRLAMEAIDKMREIGSPVLAARMHRIAFGRGRK